MRIALLLLAWLLAAPAFAATDGPGLPEGRIAILVQTTGDTAALERVTEQVYGKVTIAGPGVIEASMRDEKDTLLTDLRGEKIRAALGADRLVVIEQHSTPAGVRILRLRAFDKTGAIHRRTLEVTDETARERLRTALESLPSWRPRKRHVSDWARLADTDDPAFFDVNAFGGRKMLSESEWGALATHNEVGAIATFGGTRWPVHLALEGFGSRAYDSRHRSVQMTEFGAGARRIFDLGGVIRPYLGAGIVFVRADYIDRSGSGELVRKDRGTGGWIGAGASFRMGKFGNVGAMLRYSSADVTLGSRTVDAGGIHAGFAIGFGSARAARSEPATARNMR